MKRLIAFMLAFTLMLSMAPAALAAGEPADTSARADALAALGLFRGTDKGYELESGLNRAQGLTMLVRLLGKETEAEAGNYEHPFADVPEWAQAYVGYAWEKGITKGRDIEAGIFDPYGKMYVEDFVTFVLRALGYSDAEGDFERTACLDMAFNVGLVTARGKAQLRAKSFARGDMVDLCYAALSCEMKPTEEETEETEASGETEAAVNEGETQPEEALTLAKVLIESGVFSAEQAQAYIYAYKLGQIGQNGPVTWEEMTFQTSQGEAQACVVTVDMSDDSVSVKAAIVDDTVGARDDFANIVSDSGAVIAVTGNFMDNDANGNLPLGHIMIDGEMKYVSSGFSSLGITADGKLRYGRPSIFTRVYPADEGKDYDWTVFGTNVDEKYQSKNFSIIYTPVYGESFEIKAQGFVTTVVEDIVTDYRVPEIGELIDIPEKGYVMFIGENFSKVEKWNYHAPELGERLCMEYILETEDAEGFTLEGLQSIISSGPRLVTKGERDYFLEYQLDGPRFKEDFAERIAVGSTESGELIIVMAPWATIQQMREIMLALGCVDAINMDGGASAAMYVDGEFVMEAGRKLANTIQVFID